MDHKIYSILGFFWQYLSPQPNDGLFQIIGGRAKFRFTGALFTPASYGADKKAGEMNDNLYGSSVLSNVAIELDCLAFDAKYLTGCQKDAVVSYSFQRKNAIWVGEYSSSTGTGLAKCILTEVPWEFFEDDARSTCRGALS